MSNENYVNYFVEIMTSALNEAVVRNISLQANAKITDEVIGNLQKTVEELTGANQTLAEEIDSLKDTQKKSDEKRFVDLNNAVNSMSSELSTLRQFKIEFENAKSELNHMNTFRSELVKERNEHEKTRKEYEHKISELNKKIDYLQLTPAKRKKIDEAVAPKPVTDLLKEPTEDGGTF